MTAAEAPRTDQLSTLLLRIRRETTPDPVAEYLTEMARREHIGLERIRRQLRTANDLGAVEHLAQQAREAVVVERRLNAELDALRAGGR